MCYVCSPFVSHVLRSFFIYVCSYVVLPLFLYCYDFMYAVVCYLVRSLCMYVVICLFFSYVCISFGSSLVRSLFSYVCSS